MGSAKDMYDLISELVKKSNDKVSISKMIEIKAFISSLESANFEINEKYLHAQKEIVSLNQELFGIGAKIAELEREKEELLSQKNALASQLGNCLGEIGDLKERLLRQGTRFSFDNRMKFPQDESGQFYCPHCLTEKEQESPLETESYGWQCPECNNWFSHAFLAIGF